MPPVAASQSPPWHRYLTIDLLVGVLAQTLFHPFVAWMFPLSVRALAAPTSSVEFRAACAYAAAVTLAWVLAAVDRRIAYGPPRPARRAAEGEDDGEDVVVITGGAGGLGGVLAQMFGQRGASVAVLDVQPPPADAEDGGNVRFYHCNVGDAEDVERARKQIEKDLGIATILINNAGIVNARRLWELTPAQIERNFSVNLAAHFYTIRAFLPGMLVHERGGTIVTVSSVLGKLGSSHLSDYTAAKAGLNAMHTSFRAELNSSSAPKGAENIRTILVTPGQLSTALFADVETPSNFFGPVVEPVDLARAIVKMIDAGESGEISLPLYTQWIEWLSVLPAGMQRLVRALSGLDSAMELGHQRERKQR